MFGKSTFGRIATCIWLTTLWNLENKNLPNDVILQ